MQVLEQDDDRLRARQQGEVPAEGHGRLVADALRLGRDARTGLHLGPEVEAEPGPDDVGSADGLLALSVGPAEPGLELLADHGGRVALGDLHPGGDDVAGERVRAVLLDVGRAAAEPPHYLRLPGEPQVEVAQQPGLADAGVTDDVDDEVPPSSTTSRNASCRKRTSPARPTVLGLDALDDAELVEPEPARSRGHDHEASTGASMPLSSRPGIGCTLNSRADLTVGVRRDEDAARGPRTAGGRRGWRSPRRRRTRAPARSAERADDDLAGVDADPHPRRDAEAASTSALSSAVAWVMARAGADRPFGVVLVGALQAEDGHDGVADELLDHPAVGLDRRLPAGEARVDDGAGVLRVQPLGHDGEVDEVGEENADQLALLAALAEAS